MSTFESPIPLSDIESVLAWVDTFKLSRPTKKINRDFSDAVLLAEILNVHYPKLVEMHNYPPRNSHALKLNNWMTLNRKVLKKLKLNLCCNTMEQLANCASGVIERVLVMVRDKIRRDEELNKSLKDSEQNMSSGGSYYEACGEDENILIVPVKTRVNGILETVQQKVVNYDSYLALKEEFKDAKDSTDVLKQKVEHLDSLLKLKEERIEELQKQLERKQSRRREAEAFQNTLQVPFEIVPSPDAPVLNENPVILTSVVKSVTAKSAEAKISKEETRIPIKLDSSMKTNVLSKPSLTEVSSKDMEEIAINIETAKPNYIKVAAKDSDDNRKGHEIMVFSAKPKVKPNFTEIIVNYENDNVDVDRIKSDVFKEIEIVEEKIDEKIDVHDLEEFKDSEQDTFTTIEETIQKEIKDITNPMEYMQDMKY